MLQNRLFVALASRSGFGAAISDAIARSSIVFSNSVSADRIVVAASRLLGAAAACVILLSFAAEDRKSYWNGCIKAAKVICEQIFSILALIQNRLFVALASRSSFGAAIPVLIMYKKASLCKNISCKSLLCVKASLSVKASLCKSFCVCKRLPCVKALCVSFLCVNACCVWKLAVCKSFSM